MVILKILSLVVGSCCGQNISDLSYSINDRVVPEQSRVRTEPASMLATMGTTASTSSQVRKDPGTLFPLHTPTPPILLHTTSRPMTSDSLASKLSTSNATINNNNNNYNGSNKSVDTSASTYYTAQSNNFTNSSGDETRASLRLLTPHIAPRRRFADVAISPMPINPPRLAVDVAISPIMVPPNPPSRFQRSSRIPVARKRLQRPTPFTSTPLLNPFGPPPPLFLPPISQNASRIPKRIPTSKYQVVSYKPFVMKRRSAVLRESLASIHAPSCRRRRKGPDGGGGDCGCRKGHQGNLAVGVGVPNTRKKKNKAQLLRTSIHQELQSGSGVHCKIITRKPGTGEKATRAPEP